MSGRRHEAPRERVNQQHSMPEPVVIDLGELSAGAPDEIEFGPRRPRPARPRRAVAVAAALAVLATLSGGVPVRPTLVEARVPSVMGEVFEVLGDRLYVIKQPGGDPTARERTITAYRLPEGRRLWSNTITEALQEFGVLTTVGDVLLLALYSNEEGQARLIAVDADTGTPLWRRPGWLASQSGRGRLLVAHESGANARAGEPDMITAVDPPTGRALWSYAPARDAWWMTTPEGSYQRAGFVVTGLPSGRVEVRDGHTGRLVNAANLHPPVDPKPPGEAEPWLAVADGRAFVNGPDESTYTAYDLPGLNRLWGMHMVPENPHGWFGFMDGPAGLLLHFGGDGRVLAVDRDSGRIRWTGPWEYLERIGPLLLATGREGPFGGATDLEVVDPRTGQGRKLPGRWALATRGWEADVVVTAHDIRTRRAWFGLVEPAGGSVRLLGVAQGVIGECRLGRDCVVCRRRDDTIGIWRYR